MRHPALVTMTFLLSFGFILSVAAEEEVETADSEPKQESSQILVWEVPKKGAAKLLPNISLIGSLAGAYFRDDPAGEQGENPSRTGFNLQGLELSLQSVVDPYIRADIFILFKEDEVEVEEAFITTLSLPANLQIRAGILLAKLGLLNTQHIEQWDFVDQAFANRYFFGVEGFGELGLELSWLLPTPWFSELSLEWLQGENDVNFNGTAKSEFVYLGHWKNFFELTNDLSFQVGASGAFGKNENDRFTQIYGTDFYLRWRPSERLGLKWQTEYVLRRLGTVGQNLTEGGLYSQVVFQFARRWEAGLRYDHIGWPSEGFNQTALSPVLTFLASEFFRLRAQYNYVDDPSSRIQHQAFLQLQFNMGPHGAHIF